MAPPTQKPRRAINRIASFRHAAAGWWYVLRTQENAWIHAVASVMVFAVGLWLGLDRVEWAIILLTVAGVWVCEFLNTAIEAIVDLASPEYHDLAKIGKDVGAAAVLLASLTSVLIGLLILGPKLLVKLGLGV